MTLVFSLVLYMTHKSVSSARSSHFNQNMLEGSIPDSLFNSNMKKLKHMSVTQIKDLTFVLSFTRNFLTMISFVQPFWQKQIYWTDSSIYWCNSITWNTVSVHKSYSMVCWQLVLVQEAANIVVLSEYSRLNDNGFMGPVPALNNLTKLQVL